MISHADLIRAALDGKEIQWRAIGKTCDGWREYGARGKMETVRTLAREDSSSYEYRIKPEPDVRWRAITKGGALYGEYEHRHNALAVINVVYLLRIEYSEPNVVSNVTVEKP